MFVFLSVNVHYQKHRSGRLENKKQMHNSTHTNP